MGLWAKSYIEKLQRGEVVTFRPHGNSMTPLIKSGDVCTVSPIGTTTLQKGNIVLCKIKGNHYLHKIIAVGKGKYLIGNNHGRKNGWCRRENIYGLYRTDE